MRGRSPKEPCLAVLTSLCARSLPRKAAFLCATPECHGVFWGHSTRFVVGLIGMVSLEFNGLGAGEIRRYPDVEALRVT